MSGLVSSVFLVFASPVFATVHWQTPANYVRTPSGSSPTNPVTFSVEFDDESGCPNQTYRFWLFRDNLPVAGVGSNTTLQGGEVTQTADVPTGEDIEAVYLACTSSDGSRYDSSGPLETGSPAFNIYAPPEPLFVSEGGTGADSFTVNGVLFGNGTSSLIATSAGSAFQVLRIPPGGGAPAFGAIDLSQSAAVTGMLSVSFGGTGTTTTFSAGSLIFAGSGGAYLQNNALLFWNNSTGRLGIGTNTPGSTLEVNGTIAASQIKSLGSTPGVNAGACAGAGGSASITGTDTAGEITLNTGTAPPGSSPCLTVTFATAYASSPSVILNPSNPGSGLLAGMASVYAESATSTFQVYSTLGLLGSSTYKWHYIVVE